MTPERVLFTADGIADGVGLDTSPGAALVEYSQSLEGVGGGPRLLAAGAPEIVLSRPEARSARRQPLVGCVLLPGMVNAHTHLDLTHIGPLEYVGAGGFSQWAQRIAAGRRTDATGIRESVTHGVRLSIAGGVVAVGDIAGALRPEAVDTLRESELIGVSFLEFFGVGAGQDAAGDRLESVLAQRDDLRTPGGVRLGLQPHAPYSVGPRLYERAVDIALRLGLPLSTHLSEMIAEREFIGRGGGPLRQLLERLGVWDETVPSEVGRGRTPIGHLANVLSRAPFVLAHVNDCSDADLAILARCNSTVAYCPRSSSYFENDRQFGAHRYRDMLKAGINVALGTDSIVNIPREQADRLSVLDEMRFLWNRDEPGARLLLAMGTIHGARALGLDPRLFTLDCAQGPHAIGGLASVDLSGAGRRDSVAEKALSSSGGVRLVAGPGASH